MKPNINDAASGDLRRALAARQVTESAIATIEKALKRGLTFRRFEDLALLNLSAADLTAVHETVDFGPASAASAVVKTVEYQFPRPGPNASSSATSSSSSTSTVTASRTRSTTRSKGRAGSSSTTVSTR